LTKDADGRPAVEFLGECLEYRDGVLYWKARPASHFQRPADHQTFIKKMAGKPAGRRERGDGYVSIGLRVEGRAISMAAHRIVWALHHGKWPDQHLDHINRIRHDNRIENLREATPAENARNAKSNRVHTYIESYRRNPDKFVAWTNIGGQEAVHLGIFDTEAEAVAHRDMVNAELVKLAKSLAKKGVIGRPRKGTKP
jgi:hypothetical protein